MNERIEQLARQAGINCVVSSEGSLEYAGKGEVEHLKKFAELIVQECMDIAREVGTSTEPEDFALDRCYEIETKIKEQFGVE